MKKLLLILICLPLLVFSQTEKRLALVIGNANYDNGELTNPVNDARLIKKALDSLNFEVHYFENLTTKDEVYQSVRGFVKKLDGADISFIYYSGHGIQVDGQNYLVPTKVELTDEEDVKQYCYEFSNIMRFLSKYDDQVNIVVLDACRNNRYENSWSGKSYGGNGLASMDSPDGCILAFSTKTGKVAKDNSFYAKYLSEYMLEPGLEIKNVFQRVRTKVNSISKGKQTPVETHQMFKDYYLVKSNYSKDFEKILKFIDDEKYFKALEIANKIITLDPTNKRAYKLRADNYYALKEYRKALDNYNKAIEIDSSYVAAYYERCLIYEDRGEFNNALKDLNKIISLEPDNHNLYNRRGIVYHFYLEDIENGLSDYNKAIELNPEFSKPFVNRASLHKDLKQYDKAIDDFDKGLKLLLEHDPTSKTIAIVYENSANLYFELRQYNKALSEVNRGIVIDPDRYQLYSIRSGIYTELNEDDKAQSDMRKWIDLQDKDALGYFNRGEGFMYINMYEEAIDAYSQAMKLDDGFNKNHYAFTPGGLYPFRAVPYSYIGEYQKALDDFSTAIKFDPDESLYYNNRAVLNAEYLGNFNEALADYNKSIEIKEDANTFCGRSFLYIKLGEFDLAVNDLNKAIELDPDNFASSDNYYLQRGYIYHYKLGKYDQALSDYSKVIELNRTDDHFSATMLLSRAHLANGDQQETISSYDKLVSNFPDELNAYLARAKYFIEINEYERALYDYKKAIEIEITDPEAYFYSGVIHKERGEYFRALSLFEQSLQKLSQCETCYLSSKSHFALVHPIGQLLDLICEDESIDNQLSQSEDIKNESDWLKNNITNERECQLGIRDIHIEIGKIYKLLGSVEMMCENYQKACDLGACEMFNANCK